MKEKIELLLTNITITEKINILESLCKKYRRENSQKINNFQMGRKDSYDDLLKYRRGKSKH
jgi:hypothetical protein